MTRREGGKGRKKGPWRGERERQSDRYTEGGEDKKKSGRDGGLWVPSLSGMWCVIVGFFCSTIEG